jgi:hypothetical protein
MLPTICNQARMAFRGLRPELRKELVQEVIANCFVAYTRLIQLGKQDHVFPSALARFAIAQIRQGRKVGTRLNVRDVSSQYAQRCKDIHVERLDQFNEEEDCWKEIVVEDKRATPAEIAACRLDFQEWLGSLPGHRRMIALSLASGVTTKVAAEKYGVTPSRISQLRQWLKESWDEFQGQIPSPPVAMAA